MVPVVEGLMIFWWWWFGLFVLFLFFSFIFYKDTPLELQTVNFPNLLLVWKDNETLGSNVHLVPCEKRKKENFSQFHLGVVIQEKLPGEMRHLTFSICAVFG